MSTSPSVSRRAFMQRTATVGAIGAVAPYFVPASALGNASQAGANEKIRIGLIGAGGMGRANLSNCARHKDVVVTAVCDVWKERADAVVQQFPTAKPYRDYREMLAQKDLDGVIIATPPHWHCLIAVEACQSGKDIYLQKPMTLHVSESLAVKEAVNRHNRVSQIGTQIHAGANYRRVVELIQSGNLGDINVVRTFNVMNQGPHGIGKPAETSPPKGLDWNFWMGPAPEYPFNPLIVRSAYENCSFMDYSGGWTPGMAPHIIDLPYWALGLGIPKTTFCSGGRFVIDDCGDAPDTQEMLWRFDDLTLTWMMNVSNSFGFDFGRGKEARRLGIYFHGVNGTLFTDYSTQTLVPEGDRMKGMETPPESIAPSPGHEIEWVECIRSRKQPSCCVDYHYKIDLALVLGNLSMKLGRAIEFDEKTHTIVNDPEAAKLATPDYRAPWEFPSDYLPA